MNRLDKFKQKRTLRQKYLFAAFISVFILTSGMLTSDYQINTLMSGNRDIEMVSLVNKQTFLEITLFNRKILVNTQYINRDLKRLQSLFKNIIGV